jgi:hypothetical protein
VTFVLAPVVHVTVTVPLPLSGVVALVTTGSYAPKATGAVVILQFAATVAVTDRFCVAVVASTPEAAASESKDTPVRVSIRAVNFCLSMISPILRR